MTGIRCRSKSTSPRSTSLWVGESQKRSVRYSLVTNFLVSMLTAQPHLTLVYGPENVTSGASSDLQHATRTARAMVKVRHSVAFAFPYRQYGALMFVPAFHPPQNWGYSHKIGPVYLNDREDTISPKKKDEIEDEVRRYVSRPHAAHASHPFRLPCDAATWSRGVEVCIAALLSADGRSPWAVSRVRAQGTCRLTHCVSLPLWRVSLLIAGESRVTALLKSKADELHRVRALLLSSRETRADAPALVRCPLVFLSRSAQPDGFFPTLTLPMAQARERPCGTRDARCRGGAEGDQRRAHPEHRRGHQGGSFPA